MTPERARALERILEALIEAGEGEAFIAVARRIARHERVVRVVIQPPLDDTEPLAFDIGSAPTRFREVG